MTELTMPLVEITELTVSYEGRGGRWRAVITPVVQRLFPGQDWNTTREVIGWVVTVNDRTLPALLPSTDAAMGFAADHLKRLDKKEFKHRQREEAFERRTLELVEAHPDPRDQGNGVKEIWPRRPRTTTDPGTVTMNQADRLIGMDQGQ